MSNIDNWDDDRGVWDRARAQVRFVPMSEMLMRLTKEQLVEIIMAYREDEKAQQLKGEAVMTRETLDEKDMLLFIDYICDHEFTGSWEEYRKQHISE